MRRSPKAERVPTDNEILFTKVMSVYSRSGYTKAMIKQAVDLSRILLFPKQSNAFIVAIEYGKHTLCTAAALSIMISPGKDNLPAVPVTRSANLNEEYFND